MKQNRVVITGYGAVSPYGVGTDKMLDGLFAGRSSVVNIRPLLGGKAANGNCFVAAPLAETPDASQIPRKHRRNMGLLAEMAYRSAADALAHAAVPQDKIGSPDLGVVFSSSLGSAAALEEVFRVYLDESPQAVPQASSFFKIMSHTCSANVAHALGIKGVNYSVNSTCASSTQALGIGYEQLKQGRQEIMICGGSEEMHPMVVSIFDLLQAASWKYNEQPSRTPRPFDAQRDGTVCGAGAGALILETEESACRRGARVFGEIVGYYTNLDTASMAQSSKESIEDCMRRALADAEMEPGQVDYINAHATATVAGDISEAAAIAEVFAGLNVPVSSLKGHMGHTLAASGALETIASLEMMRRGRLVPTLNLELPDPALPPLHHVPAAGLEKKVRCFVKNSFAFGGVNAVLIIKEYTK
jgi:3-oxoacyl-[acyl-carrier-protein] synthase II